MLRNSTGSTLSDGTTLAMLGSKPLMDEIAKTEAIKNFCQFLEVFLKKTTDSPIEVSIENFRLADCYSTITFPAFAFPGKLWRQEIQYFNIFC